MWGQVVPVPGPYFRPLVPSKYQAHCLYRKVCTNLGPYVIVVLSPSWALIAHRSGYPFRTLEAYFSGSPVGSCPIVRHNIAYWVEHTWRYGPLFGGG